MLQAVKENGHAVQYAGDGLKEDREFVLQAVRQNGLALQHAAPCLKGDMLIVDNCRLLHDGLPGAGPRRLRVALMGEA